MHSSAVFLIQQFVKFQIGSSHSYIIIICLPALNEHSKFKIVSDPKRFSKTDQICLILSKQFVLLKYISFESKMQGLLKTSRPVPGLTIRATLRILILCRQVQSTWLPSCRSSMHGYPHAGPSPFNSILFSLYSFHSLQQNNAVAPQRFIVHISVITTKQCCDTTKFHRTYSLSSHTTMLWYHKASLCSFFSFPSNNVVTPQSFIVLIIFLLIRQ